MNWLIILLLLFLLSPAYGETVCSVHDGDTLNLCDKTKVRLHGIDAPELKQPHGYQARDYLRELVMDRDVSLKCVGKSYKRQDCSVYLNGQDVQAQIVKAGLAWDSPHYSKGHYRNLEQAARQQRLGLWQDKNIVSPYCYRNSENRKCVNLEYQN